MAWEESPYSRDTRLRLARSGAWMRVVVQDDACPACMAHKDRVYSPEQAPHLPIPNCTSPLCRCRFEAVDPVSNLTVPELVARGAQLVRARLKRGAINVLRRAVALDELYEPGWLWLSAVVDDPEKVQCLEKVLQINPGNYWARKKLHQVQHRLGIRPRPDTAPLVDLPLDVLQIRAERQVIIEQWQAFMQIIHQVAPQIARDQAMAFLRRLDRANIEAVDHLSTVAALRDEMEQQWRELDQVGRSLAQAVHTFAAQRADYHADEKQMREVLQFLFDTLTEKRQEMKRQVELYGGRVS